MLLVGGALTAKTSQLCTDMLSLVVSPIQGLDGGETVALGRGSGSSPSSHDFEGEEAESGGGAREGGAAELLETQPPIGGLPVGDRGGG